MINVILGFKGFLNAYDIIVGLTNGGPGTSTRSIAMTIFSGFTGGDYAYQMANATIFFLITIAHRPPPTLAHPRKERPLMSSQPALVIDTSQATRRLEGVAAEAGQGPVRQERVNWSATIILDPRARSPCCSRCTSRSRWRSRRPPRPSTATPSRCRRRSASTASSQAWDLTNFPRGVRDLGARHRGHVVGTIFLAAFASYAIVRNWDRRLFRYSFFYLLAAMFIPFPVVALPQIQLTGLVGLANPVGVTILHIMFQLSFSVLLFTAFLRSIPLELEESARIDGATTWQTFWH